LHRLVRLVGAGRRGAEQHDEVRRTLTDAVSAVYPNPESNPKAWPRVRRIDAIAFGLVGGDDFLPTGTEEVSASLLDKLGMYRRDVTSLFAEAPPLFERALAIREKRLGPEHPDTATVVNNLAR